jgi:uncharacterized protein YjbJ (UPF0337 family)
MWNKDEIEGKGKQIKGAIKDKVGEWTDNDTLEEEGEAERAKGNLQQAAGKAKRKAGEFVDDVKKEIVGN